MITFIAIFFTLFVLTFLGYGFHWMFHQPWSGRFFKAHMNHHTKQYPPSDFYSDEYRDPGKDNTVWLFALVFSPIVLTMIALTVTGTVSLFMGLAILAEMGIIGWLNNSLHDSFHLRNSFWDKFPFFEKLRKLHFEHHVDMSKNFGIFSFIWDKIFGTYHGSI